MTEYPRIINKDMNRGLLREELSAVQSDLVVNLRGFQPVSTSSGRIHKPLLERYSPGGGGDSSGSFKLWIEPGELVVKTATELSTAEEASVDVVLAAHDSTGLSQEQIREDQDVVDVTLLAFDYRDWDSLSDLAKDASHKLMLRAFLRRTKDNREI